MDDRPLLFLQGPDRDFARDCFRDPVFDAVKSGYVGANAGSHRHALERQQHLRVRNEIWRKPLSEERLAGIDRRTEREIAPGLLFGIADITPEEAERMIDEDAGLLERLGANTKENGIRELRRSVLLRLMEAFQYQIANAEAAIRIAIPEEH
jgi:hypothetical protein